MDVIGAPVVIRCVSARCGVSMIWHVQSDLLLFATDLHNLRSLEWHLVLLQVMHTSMIYAGKQRIFISHDTQTYISNSVCCLSNLAGMLAMGFSKCSGLGTSASTCKG